MLQGYNHTPAMVIVVVGFGVVMFLRFGSCLFCCSVEFSYCYIFVVLVLVHDIAVSCLFLASCSCFLLLLLLLLVVVVVVLVSCVFFSPNFMFIFDVVLSLFFSFGLHHLRKKNAPSFWKSCRTATAAAQPELRNCNSRQ